MRHIHILVVFFISLISIAVSNAATPTQTPIPPAFFQQTQQNLLTESLISLTQMVSKLNHDQAVLLEVLALTQQRLIAMQMHLQEVTLKLGYGLLLLIFLLLCYFEEDEPEPKKINLTPPELEQKAPELSEANDTRDEYDFMSTKQAIPAKLDLARTYIDMGDVLAAKGVLEEVVMKGDETQAQEARQLITGLT